jgi:hypothetical protein
MNQNLDDGRSGVKISQEGSLLTASPVSPQSLRIDPEFKNLIPPLSTDERRQLETNLIKEGCRDPLVVWAGHDILLDGHNRWEICCQYSIDCQTVEIELPDWEAGAELDYQQSTEQAQPDQRSFKLFEGFAVSATEEAARGNGCQSVQENANPSN